MSTPTTPVGMDLVLIVDRVEHSERGADWSTLEEAPNGASVRTRLTWSHEMIREALNLAEVSGSRLCLHGRDAGMSVVLLGEP